MDNYLTIKSNKFLIHLAGWLCFLFYPFLLGVPFREDILIKLFFQTSLLATFFYINSAIFVPHFLIKRRIASYIGSVIIVIAIIVAANYFFNHLFELDRTLTDTPKPNADLKKVAKHANHALRRIVIPVFSSLFILAASTSYVLLVEWFKNERKKKEIENENLVSELS